MSTRTQKRPPAPMSKLVHLALTEEQWRYLCDRVRFPGAKTDAAIVRELIDDAMEEGL